MNDDAVFRLHRQTEAARSLLKDVGLINAPAPGDGEEANEAQISADRVLIHDTVEGETGLLEAIDTAYASILDDEIQIAGIEKLIADFDARKRAAKNRRDLKRTAIHRAMEITGLDAGKLVRPAVTIFVSKKAPKLVVTDESVIPTRFFIEPPKPAPVLDTKALEAEVKARADKLAEAFAIEDAEQREKALAAVKDALPAIPGAELDNGSASINFRRK